MIFGKGGSATGAGVAGWGARGAALSLWTVLVAGLGIALVTGCGGGGGGGGDDDDDGGATTTIVGRVIENNSSDAVSAITVTFGTATTKPDEFGNFRFEFPDATPVTMLKLNPDTVADYHDVIYADTDGTGGEDPTTSSIGLEESDGVSVPATDAGVERNIGDLRIFSTDGPPPPPSL